MLSALSSLVAVPQLDHMLVERCSEVLMTTDPVEPEAPKAMHL